ncbi:MAG: hypothetical protein IAE79_24655 [Anaerolinea sp.]|nr:hypothetical protein [Anaerolinea sp.]
MTQKDKRLLTQKVRLEVQAKIGPLFDLLYAVIVTVIGVRFLLPYLPEGVGIIVMMLLLLSGLRLRGIGRKAVTRSTITNLLKALLTSLEQK